MISKELLSDIVAAIIESADEIYANKRRDQQEFGQLLAFAEALSIIRDTVGEEISADIGLNFDIDEKYLYSK